LNALWYYAIAFIIIWVLAFLFKDKLKIDIEGPLLMRRTQRLRDFIDSVANRSPRFWRMSMNIGLPVAVFFMLLILALLIVSLQTLIQAQSSSVGLILPGVDIPGSPIFIPLGYGIIALMTVMVIHEFGHGIISRVEGVRIKSIGVLLLAVLPGAFVEPDEEDIKKSKRISKLRIYAAGSVFNLALAAVSLIIVIFITLMTISSLSLGIPGISVPGTNLKTAPITLLNENGPIFPTFHTDGVEISSVVPKSPADGILQQGMIIQSINGIQTSDINNYLQVVNQTKIGETLTFKTDQGILSVKAGVNPNNSTRGYIGIRSQDHLIVNSNVAKTFGHQIPWFVYSLNDLFTWIFILNFAVGTFNLLPMKPLDGGLILEELLGYKLSENRVKKIITPLSYVLILIIAVSIVYSLGKGISLLL
jgi:membrane-associated protease RseP (regulator of RpoE activity)